MGEVYLAKDLESGRKAALVRLRGSHHLLTTHDPLNHTKDHERISPNQADDAIKFVEKVAAWSLSLLVVPGDGLVNLPISQAELLGPMWTSWDR